MEKQDLKSLLENIYHLLVEDDFVGPPAPKPVYGPSYDLPTPVEKDAGWLRDQELLYGPTDNDQNHNIKPEEYIDWVIRNMHHNNTPFTQEEIERYFTDSVKLKNIHSTLIEEAPLPTAEEPRGTVQPGYAPGMSPQERTSFYDRSAQAPTLPPVGPWNGGWWGATIVWPPPTSALPPAGPGGLWISWTLDGGQILYFYVYPETPSGFFPAWEWYGSDYGFVQQVPDWGDGAS